MLEFLEKKSIAPIEDSDACFLTMYSLVVTLKPKKILELGVRHGDTTRALLAAAKKVGSHVTSVDINPTQFECPEEFKDSWEFVLSDAIVYLSQSIAREDKWNMVFIDDWHTADHVFKELSLIDHMVDNKTLILLHDLMWNRSEPEYNLTKQPPGHEFEGGGPAQAVFSFVDKHPEYEFCTLPVQNGLTILRKTK